MHYTNQTQIGPVTLGSYPSAQRLAVFFSNASDGDDYFDDVGGHWYRRAGDFLQQRMGIKGVWEWVSLTDPIASAQPAQIFTHAPEVIKDRVDQMPTARLTPIEGGKTLELKTPEGITKSTSNSVSPDNFRHAVTDPETGKSRQLKPEEYFFAGMEITKRATQMEATITAQTMEPDFPHATIAQACAPDPTTLALIDAVIEVCAEAVEEAGGDNEEVHADAVRQVRNSKAFPTRSWRCFHCDELFLDEKKALAHFGASEMREPICHMTPEQIREMEEELDGYRDEDTALHRQIASMRADHATALRVEEEKGYARGLRDARMEGIEPIARETAQLISQGIIAMCKAAIEDSKEDELSKDEHMVLAWLAKEDSSALGECQGETLHKLIARGFAAIEGDRVYATDAGLAWLKRSEEQIDFNSGPVRDKRVDRANEQLASVNAPGMYSYTRMGMVTQIDGSKAIESARQTPIDAYMKGYEDCVTALRSSGNHAAADNLCKRVLRVKERAEQLYGRG